MADREHPRPAHGDRPGELALSLGLVALVFAFVPVIGDFVVPPAALAAVTLGVTGVRRADTGRATNYAHALTGLIFGILAVLCYALVFALTRGG